VLGDIWHYGFAQPWAFEAAVIANLCQNKRKKKSHMQQKIMQITIQLQASYKD